MPSKPPEPSKRLSFAEVQLGKIAYWHGLAYEITDKANDHVQLTALRTEGSVHKGDTFRLYQHHVDGLEELWG